MLLLSYLGKEFATDLVADDANQFGLGLFGHIRCSTAACLQMSLQHFISSLKTKLEQSVEVAGAACRQDRPIITVASHGETLSTTQQHSVKNAGQNLPVDADLSLCTSIQSHSEGTGRISHSGNNAFFDLSMTSL